MHSTSFCALQREQGVCPSHCQSETNGASAFKSARGGRQDVESSRPPASGLLLPQRHTFARFFRHSVQAFCVTAPSPRFLFEAWLGPDGVPPCCGGGDEVPTARDGPEAATLAGDGWSVEVPGVAPLLGPSMAQEAERLRAPAAGYVCPFHHLAHAARSTRWATRVVATDKKPAGGVLGQLDIAITASTGVGRAWETAGGVGGRGKNLRSASCAEKQASAGRDSGWATATARWWRGEAAARESRAEDGWPDGCGEETGVRKRNCEKLVGGSNSPCLWRRKLCAEGGFA